ncbi:hypothetical protein KKH18_06130 [bacterium]|nr:hypothetical protein [bacterium]
MQRYGVKDDLGDAAMGVVCPTGGDVTKRHGKKRLESCSSKLSERLAK